MTEEIISRLSNIPDLRVKSRQSVMQYRGKSVPAGKIARELGVGNILQGSVRKQDNQVLITVQLVQGETEEMRWSITYNRELRDIFEVQSDIAQQVASKFGLGISEGIKRKLATPPTRNVVAYDLYLKAIADADMESGIGSTTYNRKAIDKLKQAVALDTFFADAYARLCIQYTFIAANEKLPGTLLDSARYFAERAIRLDPGNEKGYIALASVDHLQGRQDESLRNLVKAEGLRPYSSTQAITNQLVEQHAFGEAWEWLEKARRHDPTDPVPYIMEAWIFLAIDMLDSAKTRIDAFRAQGSMPDAMDQPLLHYYLYTLNEEGYRNLGRKIYAGDEKQFAYTMGRYYLFRRNWPMADSFFKSSSRSEEIDAGLIDMNLGRTAKGKALLLKTIDARLRFMNYAHAWHAYDISRCYAALNDSRYLEYFNNAVQKGWFDYTWLEQDPFFDTVRETASYQAMWKQVQADKDRYQRDLLNSIEKLRRPPSP
jgi:TolB-like protein